MNKRIRKKKAPQNIKTQCIKLIKRKVCEQFEQHVLYGKEAKDIEIEDDCAEIREIKRNLKWIGRKERVMSIETYIPRDRFISRAELVQLTGRSDRNVREQIEKARRRGIMIVSNTKGGGYKIAENGAEWEEFVERERRRAVATFKRTTGIPEGQIGGIAQ